MLQRLSIARGGAEDEQRELVSFQRAIERARTQWQEEREQLEKELAAHAQASGAACEGDTAASSAKALAQLRAEITVSRVQLEEAVADAIRRDYEEQDKAKGVAKDAARQLFDVQENWFAERSSLERQIAAAEEQVRKNHDEACAEATKARAHLQKQEAIWEVQRAALERELSAQRSLVEETPRLRSELQELEHELTHKQDQWQAEKLRLEQSIATSEPLRQRTLILVGRAQAARDDLAQRHKSWDAEIERLRLDAQQSDDDVRKSRVTLEKHIRAAEQELKSVKQKWHSQASEEAGHSSAGHCGTSETYDKSPATEPRPRNDAIGTPVHGGAIWGKWGIEPRSVSQARSAGKAKLASPSMKAAVAEACDRLEQLYSPSVAQAGDRQVKQRPLVLSTPDVPITTTQAGTSSAPH